MRGCCGPFDVEPGLVCHSSPASALSCGVPGVFRPRDLAPTATRSAMTAQLLADAQRVLRSHASGGAAQLAQRSLAQRSLAQQVVQRLLELKARWRDDVESKLAQPSASWLSGGSSQRQRTPLPRARLGQPSTSLPLGPRWPAIPPRDTATCFRQRRRCGCCWLAERHCVCGALPALAPLRRVRRIFTVVPPQELGNPASSIKLLHAAYPSNARWAVTLTLTNPNKP